MTAALHLGPLRGINHYREIVKSAISVPDCDFERLERAAGNHGMSRSDFYRLADALEGSSELTVIANAVLEQTGQPCDDATFLRESQRLTRDGTEW